MFDLGATIRGLREARGLTQSGLASAIGVSKQTVCNYENNRREPSVETLQTIADALRVPVSRLIDSPDRHLNLFDGPSALSFQPSPDRPSCFSDIIPAPALSLIPIIGVVRAGPGGLAFEEREGQEPAYIQGRAEDYFYLRVVGDSMAPKINEGDLALVKCQNYADNGQLVVAIVKGEFNDEGVIKQYKTYPSAVSLISFNPDYEPRFFPGKEMNRVRIVGKVVQTVRKWD